jgi:predicted unusual protein kinase regulating ubiquinone biosynthesis (AarF/ABC1/UbiB family)
VRLLGTTTKDEHTVMRRVKAWSRRNPLWRSYRVGLMLLRTLYIINRERSRVVRAHARGDSEARPNLDALLRILREFRQTAVDLGGLMIKLGQFLGARADLLPAEALDELAALHDEVPAERFEDIKAVLEREWRAPLGEVVAKIEPEPTGSASLGQVHRAELHDGRIIAIKVRRPGIAAIVRTDLRTLRFVLRVVGWVAPAANRITDLGALYREFRRTVYEELDYHQEARNAERFAAIFADDPNIVVPGVIRGYSTRRVLVLEWVDGIKITHFAALDAAGVDRDALANRLAASYFKQVLEVGFFHADPHPGNIFVQPRRPGVPGWEEDRLVFVDFGMMGAFTQRMRTGLRECFEGAVLADPALFVSGLDALGFLSESVDRHAIEVVVAAMLTRFGAMPAGRMREVDPRAVLRDVGPSLYDQPVRLPAEFAFFGRAVGILFGLVVGLSPRFSFVAVATPYAREFMGQGSITGLLRLLGVESLDTLGRDALREGVAAARVLAALPRRLDRLLTSVERGELRVVVESADLNPGLRRPPPGRGATGVLNRPVPLWLPLVGVGVVALVRLLTSVRRTPPWRRPPASS